ncbi:MAG TPA: hypothetical protein PKD91_05200 [Bacteroidia bacterium]|nr:hypothetical protein [Bacteroidia bacterium]
MELVNRKLIKWLFIVIVAATAILELSTGFRKGQKVADDATREKYISEYAD